MVMSDLVTIFTLTRKDLLQELRSKAVTVATLFFAAVVIVVLAFALSSNRDLMTLAAPGVMWVALAFAGVISAAQSYQNELEENAYEQLLLFPIPRASIFLGKLMANWLYMTILGLVIVPVTALFFNVTLKNLLFLLLVIILGTLGFALVATFYAALTANLRARESLLPVLMFPVVVPVIQRAVLATAEIVGQGDIAFIWGHVQVLLAFNLVYFVVCTALFHFVTEE
jgi:heme exporter protein B